MPEIQAAGLRLAIYARVSTEEQREGQTIDSQISELERFSREKGWPVTGTYKDEGWSGGVMERPDLDRLRDDAQKGVFDAVLINDVDRLARDVAHLGVLKRDLERKGIQVIFRKLPADTSPTYNLMVNILGSFAEFEREMIADRTRRGRRHKVEVKKMYLGSNTAYGYRYTPKDHASGKEGLLEINPQEAAVVRDMFRWVDDEGLSARRVMNRLTELKLPPKNGATVWAKSSVLRILQNEMYAGTWHYNKFQGCEPARASPGYRKRKKCSLRARPRAEWLPLVLPASLQIISRERWLRVQQQLARNRVFSPRNEKHSYLLKGLIRCAGCGARFVGDPCHGKFYYRCWARCKKVRTIRDSTLDGVVKGEVRRVLLKPDLIVAPLRDLERAENSECETRNRAADKVEHDQKRLEREEQRLLDAYRTGVISPAQLGKQLEQLKSRKTVLDQLRSELQHQLPPPEEIETSVVDYCAQASQNLDHFSDAEWRDLLRTVIRSITFDGQQVRIRGAIPIGDAGCTDGAAIQIDATV